MAGSLNATARVQRVDLGVIDLSDSEDDEPVVVLKRRLPVGSAVTGTPVSSAVSQTETCANSIHDIEVLDPVEDSAPASDREPSSDPVCANATGSSADPLSVYVSQVLEIVTDVDPDHLLALIHKHLPHYQDGVVQAVLHVLFEDPTYPKKVENKGKRKRDGEEDATNTKKIKTIDYGNIDRNWEGGRHYIDMTMHQLQTDFPYVPIPHIRKVLATKKNFYAPSHLQLQTEMEEAENGRPLPYQPKKTPSTGVLKGKNRILEDDEFERERAWLSEKLREHAIEKDERAAEELAEAEGTGIECGCCFSTYPFDKMVQCPETHLFCKTCMVQYCETQLGSHDVSITCMDQSGCKEQFPVSELRRILPEKLMELYERLKSTKEIEMAEIEGLEDCPFCDWKCTIENPDEKLFRCGNEECGVVSCRGCKKTDHLPKNCKEVEDDRVLDGKHAIEEAMTRALMRNCPKCKKAFVKEMGCNKMTCPNCMTSSCYVCRQTITGYDHFAQGPPQQQPLDSDPRSTSKCPLYDGDTEARHAEEVKAAAAQAQAEFRKENPDVDVDQIKVDLPKAPVRPQPAGPGLPPFNFAAAAPGPALFGAGAGAAYPYAQAFVNMHRAIPVPQARRRRGRRGRR